MGMGRMRTNAIPRQNDNSETVGVMLEKFGIEGERIYLFFDIVYRWWDE